MSKQNMISEYSTIDLDKYYDEVKTCKKCGLRYGIDKGHKDDGRCPICVPDLREYNYKHFRKAEVESSQ